MIVKSNDFLLQNGRLLSTLNNRAGSRSALLLPCAKANGIDIMSVPSTGIHT